MLDFPSFLHVQEFKQLVSMHGSQLSKNLRTLLLAVQYAGQNTTPSLANEVREAAVRAAAAAKKEKADASRKANEANKRKQLTATVLNNKPQNKLPKSNSSTASTERSNLYINDIESDSDSAEDEEITNTRVDTARSVETRSTKKPEPTPAPKAPPAGPTFVPNVGAPVREVTSSDPIAVQTGTSTEKNEPVNVLMSSPQRKKSTVKSNQDGVIEPELGAVVQPKGMNWEQANQVPPPFGGQMFQPCNANGGGQLPFCWHTQVTQPPPWGAMMPGAYWGAQPIAPSPFGWGMAPPPWANNVQPHCMQWGAAQPPSQMNVNVLPPTPPRVREAAMLAKMKCEVDNMKANLVEAEYKYMHR